MVTAVAGMKANGKQHIVSRFFSFEPLAIFENPENKKTARCYVAHCFCGVSEIRTRDTLLAYTRFPGVPLQPLEHHSSFLRLQR
jgi:hypothetical protein